MRTCDINRIYPADADRTDSLYLPTRVGETIPVEELPTQELRRGMCQKSAGNASVCKACPGGCRWGKEMMRRMENDMGA